MNRKQKIIVSITGIIVVMLALLGLTYGYYLTNIYGNTNTNSISITTADLKLSYGDGTGELIARGVMPGDEITNKTFTVTNDGTNDISEYTVALVSILNNFTYKSDLELSISCLSSIDNKVCDGFALYYEDNIYKEVYPSINSELFSLGIKKGETHTYTLIIDYLYQDFDQSDDMGKTLKGKVQVFDPKDTIEVTGTVTGVSEGDYAEIHSEVQSSEIIDGKYRFIGIPADNHEVFIKNRETLNEKGTSLEIIKGQSESVSTDTIIFTDTSKKATMDIEISSSAIEKNITAVNDGISKKYNIYIRKSNMPLDSENCFGGTYCSVYNNVIIKEDMTLNDWIDSVYSNEIKMDATLLRGYDLKNDRIFLSYCENKLSFLRDNYFYHSTGSSFGNLMLSEIDGDFSSYKVKNEVVFPNNSIVLNDNFEGNNLLLQNSHLCFTCLPPDTLIYVEEDEKGKKKRKKKKIKDIKVGDKILCINPYTKELDVDVVVECDGDQIKKHNEYDIWVFDNGITLTTVHRHRFYNIEKQEFVYMDEWNIGEHGYNIAGEKIKLIDHHHMNEEIEHCTIFTEKYNNYFANDMLSGNRNSSEINL